MADRLGKLRARIEADSSGWSAGIAKAAVTLKGFDRLVSRTLGGLRSFVGGWQGQVAAGLATAFGVGAIKSSLDELGRLDDLSKAFGVSAQDLQRLSLTAKMGGTDLEALAASAAKLYKALGTTGGKSDPFAAIGLSADALREMSLPEQLGTIGDALNRIESNERRVAAAMAIFGKSATDILPAIAGGYAGIVKNAREMERIGLFSDRDIQRAARAGDAMDRAGAAVRKITGELAIAVAPFLESLADGLTNLVVKLGELKRELQTWLAKRGARWGSMFVPFPEGSADGARPKGRGLFDDPADGMKDSHNRALLHGSREAFNSQIQDGKRKDDALLKAAEAQRDTLKDILLAQRALNASLGLGTV